MDDGLLPKEMNIEIYRKSYRDYAIQQQEKGEAAAPFSEWVASQISLAEVQNQTVRL